MNRHIKTILSTLFLIKSRDSPLSIFIDTFNIQRHFHWTFKMGRLADCAFGSADIFESVVCRIKCPQEFAAYAKKAALH
jgi:hypothetical protein